VKYKLAVCMWWFFVLNDASPTIGPFGSRGQCEVIQKWATAKSMVGRISPCWSDQEILPEKE